MQLVLTEGVRGLSMIVDLALDRIIVPLAVVVALLGACIIGIQLAEMLAVPGGVGISCALRF